MSGPIRVPTPISCEISNSGEELHISGIVQPRSDNRDGTTPGLYYTPDLTTHLINEQLQTRSSRAAGRSDLNIFPTHLADEAENPEQDFDMSSLMTVDENARRGFTFDRRRSRWICRG